MPSRRGVSSIDPWHTWNTTLAAWTGFRREAALFHPVRWYRPVRPDLYSEAPRFYWFSWEQYKTNRALIEAGGQIKERQPASLQFAARLLFQTYPYPETHAAAWMALYCRHVRLHPPLGWLEAIRGVMLPLEELARAVLTLRDYPVAWPRSGPFLPSCQAALEKPPVFHTNAFMPARTLELVVAEAIRLTETHYPVVVWDRA